MLRHTFPTISPLLAATLTLFSAIPLAAKVDFGRDIQPLLQKHCIECHGPTQQMRGLRLDRRKYALPNRIGANGVRIVPGKSEASTLYKRISGTNSGPQMPPAGALSAGQIVLVKTWIDEGADWPDAFSGDRTSAAIDPVVEQLAAALRNNQRSLFRKTLDAHPQSIHARGRAGWTPLMYAALYAAPEDLSLLLDRGAKPNEVNDDGATALTYAVDDLDKTRLLLERGADPNLRSGLGRTAFYIAAGWTGTEQTARLLLSKRAGPKAVIPSNNAGAAQYASLSGNTPFLRLLASEDLLTKPFVIAPSRCRDCVDLLLPFADERALSRALEGAIAIADLPLAAKLLDRGVKPPPEVLVDAALSPAPIPEDVIRTLIHRGASLNSKTTFGVSLVDLASRQGKPELVKLLRDAGAKGDIAPPPSLHPKPAATIRAAIERTLPLLQRSDAAFFQKAGCVSCHNNSLTAMTISAARAKGFSVNEQIARDQARLTSGFLLDNSAGGMEGMPIPGASDTVGYILLGLAAENLPGNTATDIWARYLRNVQREDGSWRVLTNRPPLESSDIQVSAAALRSLRAYGIKSQREAFNQSIAAGVKWLESAAPANTEDHAFKVLGLTWSGGSRQVARFTALQLLAQQRPDGGWAQIPSLASDAYATGQALTAIAASGAIPLTDPRYQRGIRFLLDNQAEDGSWFVRSRAVSIQPYFDSDFPYGHDQFISAAATNWAAMALLTVAR